MLKKILAICCLFLVCAINSTYADEMPPVKTVVSEPMPGSECTQLKGSTEVDPNTGIVPTPQRKCTVKPGTQAAVSALGEMIRYFSLIALFLGAMFIVYNGILYSMGGMDQGLKDNAKKRIQATLIGLLLLFGSGYLLQLIAPWKYV